jgi:hypothetical protein
VRNDFQLDTFRSEDAMAPNPSTNKVTLEIEITEKDVMDFRFYHIQKSQFVRRRTWMTLLIIAIPWSVALALMVFHSPQPLQTAKDLWPLLCGPPLFLIIYFPLRNMRVKRYWNASMSSGRNRNILGVKKITLSTEGIREIGEFGNAFFNWQGVEKIVASISAIYIYVSTDSGLIVPRRFFRNNDEFRRFVELIPSELSHSLTDLPR